MADVITRLKLESGEYDSKIKRAAQGLQRMEEECRKVGGTLAILEKDQLDFVKGLGNMETVSKSARGRLGELTTAFTDLRAQYNRLTQEEKQGDFGKALNASLERLKVRIQDTKQELNSINQEMSGSKFGQFGSIIDTVGNRLGVAGNLTEMLTSKTALLTGAVGAGIAVVGKATEAWGAYNAELARQDEITVVTTGLKDDDAKRMTDTMRALSDTYNVDFRDAINAVNTLMSQFGVSGDEAIRLIKDGMQGMIRGDGPKLLSMIQQFAPAFQSAGVSASQLVAVIHNSEGGIFTDQNMNAIVMGIKNIRLMTKSTSEALAKLGLDGQDMAKKMADGSMTVFDALKMVSSQMKNVDSNSQTAGEVMQQVFGRQGAMAGTNLAKAIETLNTDLEKTKKQTGEVGEAFKELQDANERLNIAIREAFSYDGWDQMAAGIRAKLVTALAAVIEKLGQIRQWFKDFTPEGQAQNTQTQEQKDMNRRLAYVRSGSNKEYWNQQNKQYYDQQVSDRQFKVSSLRGDDTITKGLRQRAEADLKVWKDLRDEYAKKANEILTAPHKELTTNNTNANSPIATTTGGGGHTTTTTTSIEDKMAQMWDRAFMKSVSISDSFVNPNDNEASEIWRALSQESETAVSPLRKLNEELAYLTKSLEDASSPEAYQDIKKVIEGKQRQIADFTGEDQKKTNGIGKTTEMLDKIGGNMAKVTNGIGSITAGLQQMGIEIPKDIQDVIGVVNGVSTILLGISALLTLINGKQDVQIITDFIPFYHRGGVVPHAATGYFVGGNRRSGDTTPIMANAGELVLNESSQNSLAADILQARGLIESINMLYGIGNPMLSMSTQSALGGQLRDGGIGSIKLEAYVEGERLHLVHNRFLRRSGQGELVTWR